MLQKITVTYQWGVTDSATIFYGGDNNTLFLLQGERILKIPQNWKMWPFHASVRADIIVFIGSWIVHNQFLPVGYDPADFNVMIQDRKFCISPDAYPNLPEISAETFVGEMTLNNVANVMYFEPVSGSEAGEICDFTVTWTTYSTGTQPATKINGQYRATEMKKNITNAITSGFGVAIKPATT